jgi:hypothetical protein
MGSNKPDLLSPDFELVDDEDCTLMKDVLTSLEMHCRECYAKSLCHSERLLEVQSKHVIAGLSKQKFEGFSLPDLTGSVKHDVF